MSHVALQQINYFQAKQLPKVNNVTDNFEALLDKVLHNKGLYVLSTDTASVIACIKSYN